MLVIHIAQDDIYADIPWTENPKIVVLTNERVCSFGGKYLII